MGKVTAVTYPDETQVRLNYDPATNDITIIDESGTTIVIEDYDWADRLVKATVKNVTHDNTPVNQIWTFEYDSLGQKVKETHPLGGITRYEYDYLGRLEKKMLPAVEVLLPGDEELTVRFIPTESYGYDDRGNKIWECGPNGHELSGATFVPKESHKVIYTYDSLNRLRLVTEPILDGSGATERVTSIEYDLAGNRESITDANGLTMTYSYDARNRLTSETNGAGETTKYAYDRVGNRISITDPRGSAASDGTYTTWYVYDALNRHIRTIMPDATVPENPFGNPELFDNPYIEYTYYLNGQKKSERDPNGIITSYEYDVRNHLKKVATHGTVMYSYFYDSTGKMISMIDAEGLETRYQYDYLGQVLKQTVGSGTKEQQETRYAYDSLGNKICEWYDYEVTNFGMAKRKTQYQYNSLGMLTAVVDAKGNSTSYYYDAVGNIRKVIDASGNVTTYDYNNLGWLIAETHIGKTATYTYDAGGRRQTATDRKGQTTSYQYYLNNLLEKVIYADGLMVEYYYDPAGNRQSVVQTDAQQNIDTDSDQSVTTWYNSDPFTKDYTPDPLNRINNVVRNINGYDYETHYSYDKLGNITGIIYPGSSQPVEYERDHLGRVKEIVGFTAPAGMNSGIIYNKMGVLEKIKLPNQLTLQVFSDELYRPSEIVYASSKGTDYNELLVMLHQYKDHENNLQYIHKIDSSGSKTKVYDYDVLDQLEKEGETDYQTIYQTVQVRKGIVTSNYTGSVLQVTYNWYVPESLSGCRIETLVVEKDSGSVLLRDYHDSYKMAPLGGIAIPIEAWQGSVRYTRSIGIPSLKVGQEVDIVVRLIGPDGRRQLLSCGLGVDVVDYRSYRIGSYQYRSDENELYNIDISHYGYQTLGEFGLSQTDLNQERLFEYDQTGNRRKVAEINGEETAEEVYEIGPGNRVTKAGDIRFEYDDNGNMIRRTNDATGEIWVYIYDARNCMTEVQKNGVTVAYYAYDPEGNRFKAIYPQEGGTNEGIYYHYDYTGMLTENQIVEETESGSRRNFVFLNRMLFARVDGSIETGSKYWYLTDHLGSAHGLMDGNGTMVWWADYEAFGKPKEVGGPDVGAVDEAPRFTGKVWDEKVGLYYFNARWYDPELGRFISEDPYAGELNRPRSLTRYLYGTNNPLRYTDPTGMDIQETLTVVIVFEGGGVLSLSAKASDEKQWQRVSNAYENAAREGLRVAKFQSRVDYGNFITRIFGGIFGKLFGSFPTVLSTELIDRANWTAEEEAEFVPQIGEDAGEKFVNFLYKVFLSKTGLTLSNVASILIRGFFADTKAGLMTLGFLKINSLYNAAKGLQELLQDATTREELGLRYLAAVLCTDPSKAQSILGNIEATSDGARLKDCTLSEAAMLMDFYMPIVAKNYALGNAATEIIELMKKTAMLSYYVYNIGASLIQLF